jgi:hypothetical protein
MLGVEQHVHLGCRKLEAQGKEEEDNAELCQRLHLQPTKIFKKPGPRDRQKRRTENKDFDSGVWDLPQLSDLGQRDTLPTDTCLQINPQLRNAVGWVSRRGSSTNQGRAQKQE